MCHERFLHCFPPKRSVNCCRTSAYFSASNDWPLLSWRGRSISTRCKPRRLEPQNTEHEKQRHRHRRRNQQRSETAEPVREEQKHGASACFTGSGTTLYYAVVLAETSFTFSGANRRDRKAFQGQGSRAARAATDCSIRIVRFQARVARAGACRPEADGKRAARACPQAGPSDAALDALKRSQWAVPRRRSTFARLTFVHQN